MQNDQTTTHAAPYVLTLDGRATRHDSLYAAQAQLNTVYPGTEGYGARGHLAGDGSSVHLSPVDSALPLLISRRNPDGAVTQIGSISHSAEK